MSSRVFGVSAVRITPESERLYWNRGSDQASQGHYFGSAVQRNTVKPFGFPGERNAKQSDSVIRNMPRNPSCLLNSETQHPIAKEMRLHHGCIGAHRNKILAVVEKVSRYFTAAHVGSRHALQIPHAIHILGRKHNRAIGSDEPASNPEVEYTTHYPIL